MDWSGELTSAVSGSQYLSCGDPATLLRGSLAVGGEVSSVSLPAFFGFLAGLRFFSLRGALRRAAGAGLLSRLDHPCGSLGHGGWFPAVGFGIAVGTSRTV